MSPLEVFGWVAINKGTIPTNLHDISFCNTKKEAQKWESFNQTIHRCRIIIDRN